ncbi:MAG TPA: hypothetical protein DIC46_03465, partial [Porphyromonadaceae bacterium]|nr:hypothetical protein [Porphyromonadaceae bacterium]
VCLFIRICFEEFVAKITYADQFGAIFVEQILSCVPSKGLISVNGLFGNDQFLFHRIIGKTVR